jgi:PKD repeat protein
MQLSKLYNMKYLSKVIALLSLITIIGVSNINAQCVASFTTVDNGNGNYTFTSTSVGNDYVYWGFGDGTWNSIDQIANHTYATNGSFNVNLQIVDSSGSCLDTAYQTITVSSATNCDAQFTYVDNGGGNISFTPTGSGPVWNWTFGDGNSSVQTTPNHTYAVNGTYWVQFTVSDSNCYDSTSQQIVVTSAIPCTVNADFTYTDNGNGYYSFVSTATGGTAPYNYLWDFGGPNTSTSSNPTFTYPINGVYHPCLTVTDANGCVSTFCDSIPVTSVAPCTTVADYTSTYTMGVGNGNHMQEFTSTSINANSYFWNFDDGGTSTLQNPDYTYTSNGTYNVCLTVSDPSGNCNDTICKSITVTDANPCSVPFTVTHSNNGGGNYSFQSWITGGTGPYTYLWNMGDGTTTSGVSGTSHAYSNVGNYWVELVVIDANFCIDTSSTFITVTSTSPCSMAVTYSYVDNGNGNYTFTPSISGGTGPYTYDWWFSGTGSTLSNPSHTFTNGLYNPTLTVTDVNGCTGWYGDTIYVNSINCNYSVTAEDSTGTDGYFFAYPYAPGASYLWDFGDGNTSTNPGPIHTYATPGTYYYCVTIDSCPPICDSITITLSPNPCNVTSSFNFVDNGNGDYSFNNTSTGDIAASYWNFGDGTISNLTNPNHTFLVNGPFVVELISIDSTGLCVDYEIVTIQVTGVSTPLTCNASFVMIPDSAGNNSILIFNTSTGSNLTYFWDFGDGNNSTLAYPFYTYTTAGPFLICLTIDDGNGCSSTYCDSINSGGVVLKTGGFNINVQGPIITSIEKEQEAISELNIYPNPFKDELTIDLNLIDQTQTEIFILDIIGNRVAQISNEILNAGEHKLNWQATNIANGVYLLNVKTANSLQVKKLILNR